MADATDDALRIAVIIGSTRDGRFGPFVAEWIAGHIAEREDMEADLIDLVDTPLPTVFPAFGQPPSDEVVSLLGAVTPRLAGADAFVIVTPEYNHSFPAPLKNAIDWHNEQWHAKPVGFVSYGGISGGLRAVEQLRVVLAEVHAVTIRNTVSFHNYGEVFGPDGKPSDPASDVAAKAMLDQLTWWGQALRAARQTRPYAV
ncbi:MULTISPECIES: NAD(P)H-dependent oxidoreductase [unclassified Streptomyces]|uniref:NADPH-dependent FMN reductase n=1 Tax=unclassified Streptomyces TaxID=2593676 RepID=UPI000DBA05E4|nr:MULTISPECIES: NAD(P)H-dependent oxidoreductase [unclassified Streptomyces]MYT74286.1 NADPH-dependent FMN reductase [Streptomyces sp. SID8367]RAJ91262.1 NAD(P)H-dependent FMN reductase [Streptomyces sp. PsTaAH-137]